MAKIILLAGVSGSGKTTVGRLVAGRNGIPFYDADDFHPAENIEKMRAGQAPDDTDRAGWLERINRFLLHKSAEGDLVLACSALKNTYREQLVAGLQAEICWVFLLGTYGLIARRMAARSGYFMPPALLRSQFDIFEKPASGLLLDVSESPEALAKRIEDHYFLKKMEPRFTPEFGLAGLGVMGKSLARNLAGRGFRLALFNREIAGQEENIARDFLGQHPEVAAQGFNDLPRFVESLPRPRKILLMIPEPATNVFMNELLPLLAPGDIVIDGGNAHYLETERRAARAAARGIGWLGTGVSGGEQGALLGPSIMVGGAAADYRQVKVYLEKIAAKGPDGRVCCARVGAGKMLAEQLAGRQIPVFVLAFLAAAAVRVLQGSATVAMITAAGIVAPMLAGQLFHPFQNALLVVAIAAGATTSSHVNDSGFWLVKQYLGLSESETFRVWTMLTTLIALCAIGLVALIWWLGFG